MEYPIDKSESKGNLGTETFTLKRRDSCSFCDAEVNASKIKDLEAKIEQLKLENSGHYLEWRRSESIIRELEKNLRKAHISEADAQEDAIFHRDQLSLHSMKVAELEKKLTSTQRTLELGKNLHHTLMANHDDNIERIEAKLKVAEMAISKANDDHWFMINLIEKYSSDKESCLKDVLERLKFRKPLYESTLEKIKAK